MNDLKLLHYLQCESAVAIRSIKDVQLIISY